MQDVKIVKRNIHKLYRKPLIRLGLKNSLLIRNIGWTERLNGWIGHCGLLTLCLCWAQYVDRDDRWITVQYIWSTFCRVTDGLPWIWARYLSIKACLTYMNSKIIFGFTACLCWLRSLVSETWRWIMRLDWQIYHNDDYIALRSPMWRKPLAFAHYDCLRAVNLSKDRRKDWDIYLVMK